ncbi:hypothetical protein [Deinococcus frigens]|uniref:hypothetical protein n=1 Tax=Deinococcus frigens TaxID=249403 RepID=UPI0004966B6B|nr:hypothetical protein [Deinococcus frigens]
MFAQLGVTISSRLYEGRVWDIKLSQALQDRLRLSQNQRIAFDRPLARDWFRIHTTAAPTKPVASTKSLRQNRRHTHRLPSVSNTPEAHRAVASPRTEVTPDPTL